MEKEIKAVAYARVSSKEQAEKELSIPAQLEAIRNNCKQKGWKLVHEYIDAGKSAKTDERPEFQRMVAMAKRPNRGFDAIIVHKIDRFSRNRDDHVIYKALLKKLGVTVYSLTEQADPETPHGFLLEGIMEVISEFYNMNLKNETMKGMKENAKRGYHNGGQAPYGYRVSRIKDNAGKLRTIWTLGPQEEVKTIQYIFNLYVRENKGYKAIVNILNEENIPSPRNGLWSWTTVWHILHNEAYIGQKVWNKHDYGKGKKIKSKDEWIINADSQPQIIDRDTFNAVIEKSKQRNPTDAAFKSEGPSLYILRGILKCPMCGMNMITGSNSKYARGKTRYYHCGTYHRKGSKACKRNQTFKEKIESAVLNAMIREFSILGYPGSLEEEIRKYTDFKNRDTQFEIAKTEDEIKYLRKRIQLASKENNDNTKEKYLLEYIEEIEIEVLALEQKLDLLRKQIIKPEWESGILKVVRSDIKSFVTGILVQPPDQQHKILKEYVKLIAADLSMGSYKMSYQIKIPEALSSGSNIILEKTLFFGVD